MYQLASISKITASTSPEDYTKYIHKLTGTEKVDSGIYQSFGKTNQDIGWAMFISVVKPQILELFELLVPYLQQQELLFKLPTSLDVATYILGGNYGNNNLGKVVCIYPNSNMNLANLAKDIKMFTEAFKGPSIPNSHYLGSNLYTQYQVFKNEFPSSVQNNIERKNWPFPNIAEKPSINENKLIDSKYYITKTIINNAKGSVTKAIYFKGILIKSCVLKQGRPYMVYDDNGRDIQDRLTWQFEVLNKLKDIKELPKTLGLHKSDDCLYLASEYIKGTTLTSAMAVINKNKVWLDHTSIVKKRILDIIETILNIASKIHDHGIIHRDLSSENFLLIKKTGIKLIDFELCWSGDKQYPTPPYKTGTVGYMSPEQSQSLEPTLKEDIYALGALIFHFLSNISPTQFSALPYQSKMHILFLSTNSENAAYVISKCFENIPTDRPTIADLQMQIADLKLFSIKPNISTRSYKNYDPSTLITLSFNAIFSETMTDHNDLWIKKEEQFDINAYQQVTFTKSSSFFNGISGILWLVGQAKACGFEISKFEDIINKNVNFVANQLFQANTVNEDLYSGTAGILLGLSELHRRKVIPQNSYTSILTKDGPSYNTTDFSLSSGLSGTGLATIALEHISITPPITSKEIVDILIKNQQRDGSWPICEKYKIQQIKRSSFSYGSGGILWFLLNYYEITNTHNLFIETAIEKSLSWYKNSFNSAMPLSNLSNLLTLIKAHRFLPSPALKKLIKKAINNIPPKISLSNISLHNGLSGIGELLIDANEAFETNEYETRLEWISNLLYCLSATKLDSGDVNWFTDPSGIPLPGLFNGQSGIVHFFLRYHFPNRLSHPLWFKV